jgi:hypothetical protein
MKLILNVVPVNELSSPLLGFVIVRAFEFDDVADVTLFVENVRPIILTAVPPENIILRHEAGSTAERDLLGVVGRCSTVPCP